MTVQRLRKIYGLARIRYKTVKQRLQAATPDQDEIRAKGKKCQELLRAAMRNRYMILQVDESSFSTKDNRRFAWSLPG